MTVSRTFPPAWFVPGNSINRAQAVELVAMACGVNVQGGPQVFADIPPTHPLYHEITEFGRLGILGGFACGGPGEPCTDGKPYFRPNTVMSRGQFAKLVYNAAGYFRWYWSHYWSDKVSKTTVQTFQDVPPGSPFYEFIENAITPTHQTYQGFTCGGPGEPCIAPNNRKYFRPGAEMRADHAEVTVHRLWQPQYYRQFVLVPPAIPPSPAIKRGQAAWHVIQASKLTTSDKSQFFEDVKPGDVFYDEITTLARLGHIGGFPCGGAGEPCVGPQNRPYFRPLATISRGQFSKVVSNAAGYSTQHTNQVFQDVPTNSPFYIWIARLNARSIVGGYPCGGAGEPCSTDNKPYFRPNAEISEQQVGIIISRTWFV